MKDAKNDIAPSRGIVGHERGQEQWRVMLIIEQLMPFSSSMDISIFELSWNICALCQFVHSIFMYGLFFLNMVLVIIEYNSE